MDVVDVGTATRVRGEVGELVCRRPWPGMTRGVWGDDERYLETYWRALPRRVDARRLGLGRRGRLLVPARPQRRHAQHRGQAHRAGGARVGRDRQRHRRRGGRDRRPARGEGRGRLDLLRRRSRASSRTTRASPTRSPTSLGKAFKPERILWVGALPKTRSAKIVRRAVRARVLGKDPGDLSSLENPESLERDRPCQLSEVAHSSPAAAAGSARTSRASSRTAGMHVTVTGRTRDQVEARRARRSAAGRSSATSRSARTSSAGPREVGELDLLVCNAGHQRPARTPLADPDEWWRTFEVNVLGVYLCCHAFAPRMVERGGGRIVNVASGAAYLPAARAAADRVRREQGGRAPLLGAPRGRASRRRTSSSSRSVPGLVKTEMTSGFPDDAPWTPPECAPTPRPRARVGRVRRARRPLPARRARSAREPARADRRDPRADLNAIRLRR